MRVCLYLEVPACFSESVAWYPKVTSKGGIPFPEEQDLGKESARVTQ